MSVGLRGLVRVQRLARQLGAAVAVESHLEQRAGVVVGGDQREAAVDECALEDGRFTLLAPDDYAGALLEVRLYDDAAVELARESLYDEDA